MSFWHTKRVFMEEKEMDSNNMFNNTPQPQETTEQPAYQQPQQSVYQQPEYQQSVYQQPEYQQSVYQQPQQPVYQQPVYQQPAYQPINTTETPVSVGEWFLSMLIMCIPCVNIIMMFVWAFGSGTKKSKSNFFKASLIWALIGIVIGIIISVVFGAVIMELLNY